MLVYMLVAVCLHCTWSKHCDMSMISCTQLFNNDMAARQLTTQSVDLTLCARLAVYWCLCTCLTSATGSAKLSPHCGQRSHELVPR